MLSLFGRIQAAAVTSLWLLTCVNAVPLQRVRALPADPAPSREQLVGAWRLVSIQVIDPGGRRDDPFYHADPTGLLIYDASGWMSVQIESHPRPSLGAHASRSDAPHAPDTAQREAAVLDTYYAYTATWDYDRAASKVTHDVDTSLIPAEHGKRYSQTVHLEGGRLVFTVARADLGTSAVQEKVWMRIGERTD